jgi:hypothetical protein
VEHGVEVGFAESGSADVEASTPESEVYPWYGRETVPAATRWAMPLDLGGYDGCFRPVAVVSGAVG